MTCEFQMIIIISKRFDIQLSTKQEYNYKKGFFTMNINPIQKINAVEQVYDQMQNLIIDGTWKPGDKLPSENELASAFGISRMTVRQAMQKLKALGLIETRTGSGSYVREVSPEDSLNDLIPLMYLSKPSQTHVFQFREMIESESVRIATQKATADDLKQIESLLKKMKKAADKGNELEFSKYDLGYHLAIVNITGNPMIIKAYDILHGVLAESMNSVIDKMKFAPALDFHTKILDAMKAKDDDLAEQLMHEHIKENYKYFND